MKHSGKYRNHASERTRGAVVFLIIWLLSLLRTPVVYSITDTCDYSDTRAEVELNRLVLVFLRIPVR